jgi:hypothetical protein
MDHEEAVRLHAAERYVLGELTLDSREAFEEHYFSCLECANDLRTASDLANALKAIFRAEAAQTRPFSESVKVRLTGWFAWLRPPLAIPAFVLLLAVAGYQNIVLIPRLKSSRAQPSALSAVQSFHLIPQNSRAEVQSTIHLRHEGSFNVVLDVLPNDFAAYRVELRTRSGGVLHMVRLVDPQPRGMVELSVPAGYLQPGQYEIVVLGEAEHPSARQSEILASSVFTLKIEQ